MSSILTLIFFSTNQSSEPPIDTVKNNITDFKISSSSKKKSTPTYTYQISPNQVTKFKFYYMSNLEKQYAICLTADAYVVFLDLECSDALDKLEEIIKYIKEFCSYDVKTYVIGKYNKLENKIPTLDSCELNNFLSMKNFLFTYIEINNEIPAENLSSTIRELFLNVYQNKKNQWDSQCGSIYEEIDIDKDISKSKCTIF